MPLPNALKAGAGVEWPDHYGAVWPLRNTLSKKGVRARALG